MVNSKVALVFFSMLKLLFILSFVSCFSQVGIGTLNPTDTLDVNGTLRVRQLPTLTGNPVVADVNGKLGIGQAAAVILNPIQDYFTYNEYRDIFWIQSTQGFYTSSDIPNFTLSKSLSISVPGNSTRLVELNYNIPLIVGFGGVNPAGYWGIGVLKNGVEYVDAGRKTNFQTVKQSPNSYYECYHVVGNALEEITNSGNNALTITYQFYLYVEQTQANYTYPIYVGRWGFSQFHPNYNHGNGVAFVKVYEN